jgi:hypothetical protein
VPIADSRGTPVCFDPNGRSICEHFRDTGRDLVRVVSDPDESIGSELRRMREHQMKGVGTGVLTELGL